MLDLALAAAVSWVTDKIYPKEALRYGHEGVAEFTVTVNESGRAEDCVITKSSGWPELDEATCKEFTARVRFKPATDSSGTPIKSKYSNKWRWEIEK